MYVLLEDSLANDPLSRCLAVIFSGRGQPTLIFTKMGNMAMPFELSNQVADNCGEEEEDWQASCDGYMHVDARACL